MKGAFFQQSLEYRLVVDGESWRQGGVIAGNLQVKNHGAKPAELTNLCVALADGKEKKVKAKPLDLKAAFEILDRAGFSAVTVAPGGTSAPLEWKFQLMGDCRVTEKNHSLYVIYGTSDFAPSAGMLQTRVVPRQHFEDFIESLVIANRFKLKGYASGKKGGVEFTLDPPDGREFSTIEELVVTLKMEAGSTGEDLSASFLFYTKEVNPQAAGFALQKGKKLVERRFTPPQYLSEFSKRVDKEQVEKALLEVLANFREGRLI
ncbi:MAG: hypothetical protein AB7P04_09790 [Bacteriovoracia bacterium]